MDFVWKGNKLTTYEDIMTRGINTCVTPEEARTFMTAYKKVTVAADHNIGYLSGYYKSEDAKRIREWFGVKHPFLRDDMTQAEIFNQGIQYGEMIKKKSDSS
jgi:hypothetical protein